MSKDNGIEVLSYSSRVAGEEDDVKLRIGIGFILSSIIAGAAFAVGSGLVNKWVWKLHR